MITVLLSDVDGRSPRLDALVHAMPGFRLVVVRDDCIDDGRGSPGGRALTARVSLKSKREDVELPKPMPVTFFGFRAW